MSDPRSPADPTVLIVEDHGDTREMYVELLSSVGLSTVDVDTADQALRHLEEIRPQVIVTTYDSDLAPTAWRSASG
jgi:CheY-like chemotaxis protein